MIPRQFITLLVGFLSILPLKNRAWSNPSAWEEQARQERALQRYSDLVEREQSLARQKVASEEYSKQKESGSGGGGGGGGGFLLIIIFVAAIIWQTSRPASTGSPSVPASYNVYNYKPQPQTNNDELARLLWIALGIIVGAIIVVALMVLIFKTGFAPSFFASALTVFSYYAAKNYAKDPDTQIVDRVKFQKGLIYFLLPSSFISCVAIFIRLVR